MIKIRKKMPTKSYSGSLIQQNFGELPDNHGYLLWNINTGEVEEKNIDNDFKFINININNKTDINNLDINIPKSDKIKVKVNWEDFSINMSTENEKKLLEKVKELTGTDSIKIHTLPIFSDINDVKILTENIDINDNLIQQNILKEYLLNNKIDENTIEKIIEIDNIINDRLNINKSKNIKWNIHKFWFNNFKSYGDDNVINWEDKNGIIQITGINRQGKSTILDAISYILYGTTMATQKREKYGDNRYINVSRDKNYCEGGAILSVDGEKYLIYRKTERIVKNNGDISSISSILEYYRGEIMDDENKLVGEKRINTQKQIEKILGDFNDFIRLTHTSADNINDLLSMDRSQFIDNIIRDAGYDIFDKKLTEFKEYKKELNLEKINLDVTKVEKEISNIKSDIIKKSDEVNVLQNKVMENEKLIIINQKEKENLISKLNKIDEDIIKIDYNKTLNEIKKVENEIKNYNESIDEIKSNILNLSDIKEFDNDLLTEKRNIYDHLKEKYLKIKESNKVLENKLIEKNFELKNLDIKIENKIKDLEKINEKSISDFRNNIKLIENDINTIKRDILKLKSEIDSLENSNNETKICPTCLKPINENDSEHFRNEIEKKKINLKDLQIFGKSKLLDIEKLKSKIEILDNSDIKQNSIFIEFENKINEKKENIQIEINDINQNNNIYINQLFDIENDVKILKEEIKNLDNQKVIYDKKIKLESDIKDLIIKINEKNTQYQKLQTEQKNYEKNKNYIEQNKLIQEEIDSINDFIENMQKQIRLSNKEIFETKQKISLSNKTIDDYNEKIEKYNYQKNLEFIHNMYIKSMHRDGLPTYLLKKSIHIINNELNYLLDDVEFSLFFDENLNLKMKSKIFPNSYNAVEGSGMERTFNAVVLKIALRKINNTSKPNFILFDEIMNKLVDNSVDYFIELLYNLKNQIDKIILIEHIHQLKYDYLINVKKDNNGISFFEFI